MDSFNNGQENHQGDGRSMPELEIDLVELLSALLKRWYIILVIIIVTVSLAGYYSYRQQPIYESMTSIIIEDERMPTGMGEFFGFGMGSDGVDLGNQIELIRSPLIINEAADLLRDSGDYEAANYLVDEDGRNINVNRVGDTDILEFRLTGRAPEKAARMADAVAQAFQDYRKARAEERSRQVITFLENQIEETEAELDRAEQDLRDFQQQEGIISLSDEAQKVSNHLSELENQMINAFISREEKRMRLNRVEGELAEARANLPEGSTVVTGLLVNRLRERLAELESQKVDYLNRGLEEDSPEVSMQQAQINSLRGNIQEYSQQIADDPGETGGAIEEYNELMAERDRLSAEINGLERKEEIVEAKIAEYEDELGELSDKGFRMSRHERDVEIVQQTFSLLSEELQRSRIAVEREVSDVRIIRAANIPENPISPRIALNLLIAGVLGLMTGVGLSFMLEFFDNTIKSESELEKVAGVPVLGIVPDIDEVDHDKMQYYGRDDSSD